MRLHITNETHFSTRALRGIISTVYRHVAKEEGRELGGLRVRVAYARTWGQAHGALGYGSMTLFFRKSHDLEWREPTDERDGHWFRPKGHPEPSIGHVASTVRHELMHNYGYHHTKRGANNSRSALGWFYDRALPDELLARLKEQWGPTLPVQTHKLKPAVSRVAMREAAAQAGLERWLRRQKLAATKVRVYRRKVQYYEHKHAASKASPRVQDSSGS